LSRTTPSQPASAWRSWRSRLTADGAWSSTTWRRRFLPAELRLTLADAPEPEQVFGLDEFVRRVAKLEVVDETTALEHACAVFVALGHALAPGALRDLASQLPRDYEQLLSAADAGRRAAEERDDVSRVAIIAEFDPEQARSSRCCSS
jgi:uncharacterized protein (DUF2267 family)